MLSWSLPEIGADYIEQLLGGVCVERFRMLIGIHQMSSNVILDHLRHEPRHCTASAGDQMHDLIATGLTVERSLDTLDLSADTAHPGEELLLFTDRVRHAIIIAYLPSL